MGGFYWNGPTAASAANPAGWLTTLGPLGAEGITAFLNWLFPGEYFSPNPNDPFNTGTTAQPGDPNPDGTIYTPDSGVPIFTAQGTTTAPVLPTQGSTTGLPFGVPAITPTAPPVDPAMPEAPGYEGSGTSGPEPDPLTPDPLAGQGGVNWLGPTLGSVPAVAKGGKNMASWVVPTAIGAAGVIASLFTASKTAAAAQKAAETQAAAATYAADKQYQAASDANALVKGMYDTSRADLAPWREAGTSALGQLSGFMAPGGKLTEDFAYPAFDQKNWQDPGYDFRMSEGQKALERSAAAKGNVLGGATLKSLTRYGQGVATDEYARSYDRYNTDYSRAQNTFNLNSTNLFNRLSGIAGTGQQAVTTTASLGQNAATTGGSNLINAAKSASDYATDAAAARATGYVGGANAWNTGVGNSVNTLASLYKIWAAQQQPETV